MSKQAKIGRRGMIAAAAGAVAGAVVTPASRARATSGGGDNGDMVLGSNRFYRAGGGANSPNIASILTTIEASPNFGNFVNSDTSAVFSADARPATSASVDGMRAFASGNGVGLRANGGPGSSSFGVVGTGSLYGTAGVGNLVGVFGQVNGDNPGTGVLGDGGSVGAGGTFTGGRASLHLSPADTPGQPSGAHIVGDFVVDSNGALFYCRASGTPGTWVELTATPATAPVFHTLPTPERFVDTRVGLGGVTGPLPGGATKTFVMTGRDGLAGNPALRVPDTATTLVGNLTVIGGPNISNGSFVTLWPGGPQPTVSNINVGPGGVVANSYVVALSTVDGHGSVSVFNLQDCDYILDVTAYYT